MFRWNLTFGSPRMTSIRISVTGLGLPGRTLTTGYLVVDAKNYSRKIGKTEILQVANYLKPQGAGLVGLIFSRNGGDAAGCAHTLREQWLIHQKMILVFDDVEVESMLSAKEDGRVPEAMIGKKIEHFRLSI